jgi:hypothetical protein
MSGKRNRIEAAIQKQLILWLDQEHPLVRYKANKNEDAGSAIKALENIRMGRAEAGYPDLTLEIDKFGWTWILELELKTKIGTLNPNQKLWWSKFISTINRKGAIAYGLDEAKTAILNWLRDISDTE